MAIAAARGGAHRDEHASAFDRLGGIGGEEQAPFA
jgi:hypothetical protein